ncbi:hypothetical protein HGRIS_001091 [Hohenbuehelia grisea]|uniref:RING-type domain-containing protein n=1 Tax=Hohenbuehelia grisea TaxID=104357 RepID=A0ABR3JP89_9AGAR
MDSQDFQRPRPSSRLKPADYFSIIRGIPEQLQPPLPGVTSLNLARRQSDPSPPTALSSDPQNNSVLGKRKACGASASPQQEQEATITRLRNNVQVLRAKGVAFEVALKLQQAENLGFRTLTENYEKLAKEKQAQDSELSAIKVNCHELLKEKEDKEIEITSERQKNDKISATMSTMKTLLQCHLCTDLMKIPHLIESCGHTFCLICLQSWFTKAPAPEHADTDDPEFLLNRPKTCPLCRAVVVTPPIPAYLIGELIATINDEGDEMPQITSPWKGLFPENDGNTE